MNTATAHMKTQAHWKPAKSAPLHLGRPGLLWPQHLKRPADIVCALIALLLLSPVLLLVALLLILLQGGNPIFIQKRIGMDCKPFNIIKFRTMNNKRGIDGELLPDEDRTTWLGGLLRTASLDELPELLNILIGDMSFIGPRPWIPEHMDTFPLHTRQRRMRIRPGLSGLAQIQGRNHLTFRQRVAFDLRYIRHLSFALDANIVFYTFYKVVKREGIYQRPNALGRPSRPVLPKDSYTRGLRSNRTQRYD